MLKKNDVIKLEITDITNLGFGVGRCDGIVVFVSDTVPGDAIDARIIKVTKSYSVARVEAFIKKSDKRYDGRCKIAACKSCAYKNVKYEEELLYKEELIRRAFINEGLADVKCEPTIPSPRTEHYRNKAQFPISIDKNGEYVIGFYAPKSHRVTEARRCPLAPECFSEIIDDLANFFKRHALSVYNEESGIGLLRHIYLRRGEISGEVLLTLVINGEAIPFENELCEVINKNHPSVVGLLLNTNEESTNVILGDKWRVLFGRDYIYDTLCEKTLKITAPSFYQVNREAAEILYQKAGELAKITKNDTVLDLFCGAGSIGLSIAPHCRELIGIEIVDSAVAAARENAESNGITHAKFYTGDASDTEKLLDLAESELGRKIRPDVIILDPPRAGCTETLVRYVASLDPKRVVYISCNPATLARDAKIFKSLGYATDTVYGVDLFPGTGHVESVVCLSRK